MKLLIVYAHPDPTSFTAAIRDTIMSATKMHGHEVKLFDLYGEAFDPVLSRGEKEQYLTNPPTAGELKGHVEALKWCQGILFVHPTWWYGQPAILKGWIDRVFVKGVAFDIKDGQSLLVPLLNNVSLIGVFTTLGCPWWYWNFRLLAPGRQALLTGIGDCSGLKCRKIWCALHGIDRSTDHKRLKFLRKIERMIAAI